MTEHTVTIEKLTFGGSGLGHVEGKVCFVPYTAPGDVARVRVTSDKSSYMQAELVDLVIPSGDRVVPACSAFGSCGGCSWQHLSYSCQAAAKQEIFADLMWRSGKVPRERILPLIAATQPFQYRSRIQLKVRGAAGTLHLGFYRSGSHSVVDLPQLCHIASPAINRLVTEVREVLSLCPESDKVSQVDIATGDNDGAVIAFHYVGNRQADFADFLLGKWQIPSTGLYIKSGRKNTLTRLAGSERLSYTIPRDFLPGMPQRTLMFSPGAFSQVNYQQNLNLISTVFAWAGLTGSETILDVYCGNGNLSIPLAHAACRVVGIEEYAPSIADAVHNCAFNNLRNASYRSCSAAAGIQDLSPERLLFRYRHSRSSQNRRSRRCGADTGTTSR